LLPATDWTSPVLLDAELVLIIAGLDHDAEKDDQHDQA
jgi:hypothetical protein